MKNMKVFVAGPGRWGSFIAYYLNSIGHSVTLYGRETSAKMQELIDTRSNGIITLPSEINLTTELSHVSEFDIIVISIASQGLSRFMQTLVDFELKNKIFVLCMKGIEIESGRRLSEIAESYIDESSRVAVWLGPGHVQEFCAGRPNCMVIDSNDDETKRELVELFSSSLIRFYYGTDLLGNEIGAAAKNVIGIAAGILDGLKLSSLKGALMARGTREISRLVQKLGGDALSVYGLCHLGDYEATVFSPHSHNRRYGETLITGEGFDGLAEGYYTVCALLNLGKLHDVDLPICRAVYNIAYNHTDPKSEMDMLFSRSIKYEF